MSAIDSVSTANPASSTSGFGSLSSDQFLKIMFTELANQDPLAPNDSKELLQQLGTIRSIESDLSLTRNLESIVQQSQVASASTFIGKFVSGLATDGERVKDIVGSVSITPDGPLLNLLDNHQVPIDQVDEIVDREILAKLADEAAAAVEEATP